MNDQLQLGEQLKSEGQMKVVEHNVEWIEGALFLIRHLAMVGNPFTIEDLRLKMPPPKSPNAWGAAFSAASKQGLIRRVGYAKNELASAHARVVAVWQGIT